MNSWWFYYIEIVLVFAVFSRYSGFMEVWALEPHGFCEGVSRAFDLAKETLAKGEKLYALGLVVHNEKVIASLKEKGMISLDERDGSLSDLLRSVPDGSNVLFSAHGHDPKLEIIAAEKHLKTIDATCPFVKANMERIKWALSKGNSVVYVGKKGHLECEAALSLGNHVYLYERPIEGFLPRYYAISESKPYVVAQTTMDEEEVEYAYNVVASRYPEAIYAGGRCPSTVKRQTSITDAPRDIDLFVILGSERSNNTIRLAYLAKETHPRAEVLRVLDKNELMGKDLSRYKKAALASGASTDPDTYTRKPGVISIP
jgi:4-hydroxy-3-methylbut-2-enyl diphosphate reductase